MLDRQPTLTDEYVRLRPLREADREALYAVAADPQIWTLHVRSDRYRRPVFDRFFRENLASGGALLISEATTGRPIGHTRLQPDPRNPDAIEIGWTFLARNHWGGDTNGRVKRLLLDHCHRHYPYVVLHVAGANHRSHRAVAKIGAVEITAGGPLERLRKGAAGYRSYVHVEESTD